MTDWFKLIIMLLALFLIVYLLDHSIPFWFGGSK